MGIPIIGDVITAVKDLLSEVVVDKDKKIAVAARLREIELEAEKQAQQLQMGQVETNKIEAQHASVFVAGWRPFIGWVSGFGVAWTFVLAPLVEWISRLWGWKGVMPELDTGQLMTLILAMLGVAGYRTFEKVNEVNRDSIKLPKKKEEPAVEPTPPSKSKFKF